MLKHIATLMLLGGFAASQNANAEPVEIDDLKANMAYLSAKLPPAAKAKVSYKKDVRPLLEKSCLNCHGPKKRPKGKFRIDTLDPDLMQGGDVEWWLEVLDVLSNGEMPPENAKIELADADLSKIIEWLGPEIQKASTAPNSEETIRHLLPRTDKKSNHQPRD